VEEVEAMKVELSRANDLVKSLRIKGGEILSMSPAAAKASTLLKSGMSLTQIYSKYVEVRTIAQLLIATLIWH
jgi:nucleoprotein TPR